MRLVRPVHGAALCMLLVLSACSSRDRSNPFDPENPDTHGRPASFAAVAANGSVSLSWVSFSASGFQGFALWRRGPGDADFVPLVPGTLAPDQSSFVDDMVVNDSTYVYRIAFVLVGGAVGPPAEAAARPGPGSAWVTDAEANQILRLTPDDRHSTLTIPAFDAPGEIEVDPIGHLLWSSSRSDGSVAVWRTTGEVTAVDGGFGAPSAISLVTDLGKGWLADERFGEVVLWTPQTGVSARVEGLALPGDLATIPSTGGVWIADRVGRQLVRAAADGQVLNTIALPGRPWRIAVDPTQEDVWVSYAEDGVVERRDAAGALQARLPGLGRPFSIAIDAPRARAWVSLAEDNAVIAIDAAGNPVARADSILAPRGIAVDPRTGEVWVAAAGKGDGKGAVWLLSAEGRVLHRQDDFGRPFAIAFEQPPAVP